MFAKVFLQKILAFLILTMPHMLYSKVGILHEGCVFVQQKQTARQAKAPAGHFFHLVSN